MPFGPASLLGVERFSEESEAPLELIPGDDDARKEQIIRAVYKQVLGNAYVMDSERQVITESQFKFGEISVRELVRRIAKSDLYRSRFFDTCARYRYIELSLPSFLGRAPESFEEMRAHAERLDSAGYEADIDSFLDNENTRTHFGEWTVPYQKGWKTESCATMQEFTWSFQLLRGNSSSSSKVICLASAANSAEPLIRTALSLLSPLVRRGHWMELPSIANLQDAPTRLGVGAGEEGKPIAWRSPDTARTMCGGSPATHAATGFTMFRSTNSPNSSNVSTAKAEKSPASLL